MTNRERVLALIHEESGLTDRDIRERTGISPHQQVNSICRALEDAGLIRRVPGPRGIRNLPMSGDGAAPSRRTATQEAVPADQRGALRKHDSGSANDWSVELNSWASTLLVLPCSAGKQSGGGAAADHSLLDHLPGVLADELAAARARNLIGADFDDSSRMAALDRYDGHLYRQLGATLDELRRRHVLVISGGYGLLLGAEPIGRYNAVFRPGRWSEGLVSRCLAAYAERHSLSSVIAFAGTSTGYADAIRRTSWDPSVRSAVLLTPRIRGGGAMARGPSAIGQAVRQLAVKGRLDSTWRSDDGTALAGTLIGPTATERHI